MQVTVTTQTGVVFSLDVPEDLELENFKAFCEAEINAPSEELVIVHNGRPCSDAKKTLKDHGIKNGDMVFVERVRKRHAESSPQGAGGMKMPDFSKIQIPKGLVSGAGSSGGSGGPRPGPSHEDDPAVIRDMLRANPDQMAMLKQNNPRLADALESGNLEEFSKVLKEQQEFRMERERQRIRMLTADPMDMEAQRLIAQEIENKNIETNMELAMEYNPESFGTVVMLYIDCKVNGHHIKAFVDSGAQATIMSQKAAERCNIMRLVDRRWAGIAKGVGTQKIIGRVHMAQIQIKDDFLTSSFSILEEQPMDMLLGLDMLKRHQCSIDLKNNLLVIGSTGTATPFLAEADLPECARLSGKRDESMAGDVEEAMKQSAKEHEEKMVREAMEKSKSPEKKVDSTAVRPEDKFTEKDVQTLMKYGFDRENSIRELREKNGNVRDATAALFAKSLKL